MKQRSIHLTWPPDVFTLVLSGLALSIVAATLKLEKDDTYIFSLLLPNCFSGASTLSPTYLVNLAEVTILFMEIERALQRVINIQNTI